MQVYISQICLVHCKVHYVPTHSAQKAFMSLQDEQALQLRFKNNVVTTSWKHIFHVFDGKTL